MKIKILGSIALLFLCACSQATQVASNSQPNLKIALPDSPTQCEKYSAKLLKKYLGKITDAKFEVVSESALLPTDKAIHVGDTKKSQRALADYNSKTAPYDSIRIKSESGDIFVKGHSQRGTLYAVSTFLEDCAGIKAWADDDIFIPKNPNLEIGSIDLEYAPQFIARKTDYRVGRDGELQALQKSGLIFNSNMKLRKEINDSYATPYHSFFKILPPKKYFKDHPEWYSEINGKRTSDDAQLCLTNEEMTAEFTKVVCEKIKKNPHARFAHISQNDWNGACQCKKCTDFENAHGGVHSSVYLNFVNKVAEGVEKVNKNVRIVTFAYTFTRKAPKNIAPRHNVWIELCSIESDFAHSLESDNEYGFTKDIIDWGNLTKNLTIWDYVTCFKNYQIPFPNISILDDNIRFFAKHNAIGMFEQADQMNITGDFVRFRNWYLNKLMWNANLDSNKLIDEFLAGYYSPEVAPLLRKYLDTIENKVKQTRFSLSCYSTDSLNWLDAKTYNTLADCMQKAHALAIKLEKENSEKYKNLAEKIWRDKLPLDYVAVTKWTQLNALAKQEGVELKYPQDLVALAKDVVARWQKFGTEKIIQSQTRESFLKFTQDLPAIAQRQVEYLKANPNMSQSADVKEFGDSNAIEFQECKFDQNNYARSVIAQPPVYVADKNASNGWAARVDDNSERLRRIEINLHNNLQQLKSTTPASAKRKYDVYAYVRTKSQKPNSVIMMIFRKGTWNIYNQGTGKYVPDGNKYVRVHCGEIELDHSRRDSTSFQLWVRPEKQDYADMLFDRIVVVAK